MCPPSPPPPGPTIELTMGLNFVPGSVPDFSGGEAPEDPVLENVLPMSPQYRWLAVQSADPTLQFDPGPHDPVSGYGTAPFTAFLDDLLLGLVDGGITYSVELFLMNHVIYEGQWIRGFGHIFRLLANGVALTQEARIASLEFEVEILISVRVVP